MVMYDELKAHAKFAEEGVLLVDSKPHNLWINFLIKDSAIYLFDYHTGRLLKSLPIDEHFDHSNVMSEDLNLYLKWNGSNGQNVHIQARDQGQKLRIGLNLITSYGTKVHGIPDDKPYVDEQYDSAYCPAFSDGSESTNPESIPDSPQQPAPISMGMSVEDANQIIKEGTVRNVQSLIGNILPMSPRQLVPKKPITFDVIPQHSPVTEADIAEQNYAISSEFQDATEEIAPKIPAPDYMEDEIHSRTLLTKDTGVQASEVNMILATYAPVVELTKVWHKPNFTRKDADNFVKNKEDGTFIIRNRVGIDSTVFPYALTLAFKKDPVHIQIQRTRDEGLVLAPHTPGEHSFNSLDDLIHHYQDNRFYFTYDDKQGHVSLKR